MSKKLNLRTMVLLSTFLLCSLLTAQVNLEYTSVNEYSFNTKEALNLVVSNGNAKPFYVRFNGSIKDGNGNSVVDFVTNEALLNSGANIFTPYNLSFTELKYSNMDIAEIENTSGTYPSGNYTICIIISCVTPDCNGVGAFVVNMESKCISVHVENPTPLILATPANDAEIEETRPLYTWIPPAPIASSSSLNYSMILVEIMEGQSKADALTQNRPLIDMTGIGNPALMHPADIPELEKGKWYAWQVQAYVGKTPIAKSEQWKFKVKKKEDKKVTNRYFNLSEKPITGIQKIKQGDKIFFMIKNDMLNKDPLFSLKILNGKGVTAKIERVVLDTSSVEYDQYSSDLTHGGMTKYHMDIDTRVFIPDVVYELSIILPNNRKTIFRFEIIY